MLIAGYSGNTSLSDGIAFMLAPNYERPIKRQSARRRGVAQKIGIIAVNKILSCALLRLGW